MRTTAGTTSKKRNLLHPPQPRRIPRSGLRQVPLEIARYVHRVGRTARMGACGRAVTLYTPPEQRDVRKLAKKVRAPDERYQSLRTGRCILWTVILAVHDLAVHGALPTFSLQKCL